MTVLLSTKVKGPLMMPKAMMNAIIDFLFTVS
jgi:hypothetical protein